MDFINFKPDRNLIGNEIIAGIIILAAWALVLYIWRWLKVFWSRFALKFLPHFPRIFKRIIKVLTFVLNIALSHKARLIYMFIIALYVAWLFQSLVGYGLALLIVLITWSFFSEATRSKSRKDPIFFDTFENLDSWEKISGDPKIDKNIGNPTPSLFLPIVANNPNNSCIEAKELEFSNGIIETDIYLESGSLVNIVFRADFKGGFDNAKYYMARLDSRTGNKDGFLINNGSGWSFIAESNHRTIPNQWHKIRVAVSGESFQLFDENGLILSVNEGTHKKGTVGIFNEVANAYVDNFSVRT